MTAADPAGRSDLRLRRASTPDWPMIRRWLGRPDVIRWWGPKATTEAEVMLAMGSDHAICRIIEVDGAPVGYGHALDAGMQGWPLPPELPPGSWHIDVFVAAPVQRGRGVGARAVQLIRDEVFATTLAPAVCVHVGVGNERAVRAYEKAGLSWRCVVRDPVIGAAWLMLAERPQLERR